MPHASLVTWDMEAELWQEGYTLIAGIDEAGRGALAGPVVAAAVIFPRGVSIPYIDDSKRLSPALRQTLFQEIRQKAICIGVGYSDAPTIDDINIRQSTLMAMRDAILELPYTPHCLLIDGCDRIASSVPQRTFVRGDQMVGSIAAASITAKVTRDRLMEHLDSDFPGYGFAQHKGYGTGAHLRAIQMLGPSSAHRRTFRGVTQTGCSHD